MYRALCEAMRWAVENGILNGYGDGRSAPSGQATRAQAAQMLKNFIENQD
ncbi:MAG: S-layer homology domain-containing protein [Oscillospiraceae bacterium]|nr:S-layer homology domain-containing protein [Oscillospiraceae bacterium]MDE6933030.1 S-layer homology domain-containing protein [Oscillospiraceae bacterium]